MCPALQLAHRTLVTKHTQVSQLPTRENVRAVPRKAARMRAGYAAKLTTASPHPLASSRTTYSNLVEGSQPCNTLTRGQPKIQNPCLWRLWKAAATADTSTIAPKPMACNKSFGGSKLQCLTAHRRLRVLPRIVCSTDTARHSEKVTDPFPVLCL